MRACATEKVPADFVVRPYKVRILKAHGFRPHHLLGLHISVSGSEAAHALTSSSLRCISARRPMAEIKEDQTKWQCRS